MPNTKLIDWLRECYLADRSWYGIASLMGGKVESHRVISGDEVLAVGLLHESVTAPQYAETVRARAQLYEREKELLYGCFAVCGLVEDKAVMTPLLIYPAELSGESVGAFTIQSRRWRFNPRALDLLGLDDDAVADLSERLAGGVASEHFICGIENWLVDSDVDISELYRWPKLESQTELRKASKRKLLSLHASAHLFLASRSVNTRGVLHELKEMVSVDGGFSESINCLLGSVSKSVRVKNVSEEAHYVPNLLSEAQNRALLASREQILSVCHGPPGTGKSYTISAMAIDHAARGKSVLIVSQQDAAVDVVCQKVDEMAGGEYLTVRGGRGKRKKGMSNFLDRCLAAGSTKQGSTKKLQRSGVKSLRKILKAIDRLERDIEKAMKGAVVTGGLLATPDDGFLKRLQVYWKLRDIEDRPLLAQLQSALVGLEEIRMQQTIELIEMQLKISRSEALSSKDGYASLKMFRSALTARKGSEQAERFAKVDHSIVRQVFPVWLVALDDLHGVVPLEREIFDLVIIDEASQCDLAQVMPALYRAKHAVIVGDRKQLRHVSFLSQAKQEELAKRHQLPRETIEYFNYRDRSLMDVAVDSVNDGEATSLLNEHYRSRADIIEFSNQQFYAGGMHIMSHKPWEEGFDELQLIECHGQRDDSGVNEMEVEKVIELLKGYTERDYSDTEAPTLGVVSPFRAQIDAIRERLSKSLSPDLMAKLLNRHHLKVETAHGFQGDERDDMIVSLVVDASSPHGSRRFLEREGVFNVMITRARKNQLVLASVHAGYLPESLLGGYLTFCEKSQVITKAKNDHLDEFVHSVEKVLIEKGYETWCFEVVAGVEVDLLAVKDGQSIGLDLIGYPSASRDYIPLEMTRLLARAGIKMFPLGYAEWMKRPEECIDTILNSK